MCQLFYLYAGFLAVILFGGYSDYLLIKALKNDEEEVFLEKMKVENALAFVIIYMIIQAHVSAFWIKVMCGCETISMERR